MPPKKRNAKPRKEPSQALRNVAILGLVSAVAFGALIYYPSTYAASVWPAGASEFTEGVKQSPYTLKDGQKVQLPILYHPDNSVLGLFYLVDHAAAAKVLAAQKVDHLLEPWGVLGKVLVLHVTFEYRNTTVGQYGEIGLAILTKRKGTQPSWLRFLYDMRLDENQGLFVVNLPVTTKAAMDAGVGVWGYPKYVTDIDTSFGEKGHVSILKDEYELNFGTATLPLPTGGIPFVTFTVKDGALIRTVVNVGNKITLGGSSTAVFKDLGGHGPTVTSMRTLGIMAMSPIAAFRSDKMTSVLPEGVKLR